MRWALLLAFVTVGYARVTELTPEFLDKLLKEKRYDEYARYMEIDNPDFVKPTPEREEPMFHEDLLEGDIMLKPWQKEQQRQGIRFDKYPGSRWPNQQGQPSNIPIAISNEFSDSDKETIRNAVTDFNSKVDCVQITYRTNEEDYINIMKGNGCWSYLGRTGGAQSLSLGNGCVSNGIVIHEIDHAVGFSHEHNRHDRDDYVEVLWDNIPRRWRSQYRKNNPDQYGLQAEYDYYSIMHYPMRAPGTRRNAFRIKKDGIDSRRLGRGRTLTATDIRKIRILYGCEQ